MNFSCWAVNSWKAGTWVVGSWCTGVVPPIPPTPLPTMAGGGISYDEFLRRKRKKGDEEILFL